VVKWLIASCLFLLPVSIAAQDTDVDLFSLALEDLLNLEVTGSTLTPKSLKTVPSAVSVFNHEQIERLGLDTLQELMNLVPGFQSYRSSSSPIDYPFSSRGRRIGAASAEILVLLDGHRLEDSRTSGSALSVPLFPLAQIERVEFIRGPGSAVYGSNAMMGIINIVSVSGANDLSVGVGSNDRGRVQGNYSASGDAYTLDIFAHVDTDKGEAYWVQDVYSPALISTTDPRTSADLNVKFSWNNTRVQFQHSQAQGEDFYSASGPANGVNSRQSVLSSVSISQSFDWQSVQSSLRLSHNISHFDVSLQLSAEGDLAAISAPSSDDAMVAEVDYGGVNETRVLWHNDWKVNTISSLQFGAEVRHIRNPESRPKSNYDLTALVNGYFPIDYYGELSPISPTQLQSERKVLGLYSQYQQQWGQSTHLTVGLRYDDFSEIGSHLSPRFGLVREFGEHHSIKLLFGEAFRAPTESELNLVNNPRVLGNLALQPETAQSWDLIWLGQWHDRGLSLGYFETHFFNSIVLVPGEVGTLQYKNVNGDEHSRGLEFEISQQLGEQWILRATYTHMMEKPDYAFREAADLASTTLNYQNGKLNVNLGAYYFDEREMLTPENQLLTLSEDWQLFSKIQYQVSEAWKVFIQVKNPLGTTRRTPPFDNDLMEAIPSRGEEILLGFDWAF